MFPSEGVPSARRAPNGSRAWIGIVTFVYPDGSTLDDLVASGPFSLTVQMFDSEAEALGAARVWAEAYRLSDHTERLTGTYGGES